MQTVSIENTTGYIIKTWSREPIVKLADGKYPVALKGSVAYIEVDGTAHFLNFGTDIGCYSIEQTEKTVQSFSSADRLMASKEVYTRYQSVLNDKMFVVIATIAEEASRG